METVLEDIIEPDWDDWTHKSAPGKVMLQDAVCLSLNFNPHLLMYIQENAPERYKRFEERMAATNAEFPAFFGNLVQAKITETSSVDFGAYAKFCILKQWSLPRRFPRYDTDVIPNWNFWKQFITVSIEEAVALSCGIDPDRLSCLNEASEKHTEYSDRIRIAMGHLGKNLQPESDGRIGWEAFSAWAEAIGWDLPAAFPRKPVDLGAMQYIGGKWPWGNHETKALKALAAAAHEFWADYDGPDDAPASTKVKKWLTEKYDIKPEMAKYMAAILRADDAPNGRRKS